MAGKAYLVGAGPGDSGLITVKGKKLLEKADCIIYDRLVSPELLDLAKTDCEKIYAGKESRHHTLEQDEINRLIAEKTACYDIVVRLKGGDPYVFGRGGEEALYLRKAGIDFEVVPGISSALAGPAYAGIPITHRGLSSGFHVVTAHDRRDTFADIDFKSIAKSNETCVFLMGLKSIGEIAGRLIQAGMDGNVKAAVISNATTAEQKICVAPLNRLEKAVQKAKLVSPALIVTGNVVGLRDKLNFFEKRPLFGQRYLVPKIGTGISGLTKLLRRQGAVVREVIVGNIVYNKGAFASCDISGVSWFVFTSKNGVNGFFANIKAINMDARALAGAKIAAIGSETKRALGYYGIVADLVPDKYNSDALCSDLAEIIGPEDVIFYPKAVNADNHLRNAMECNCVFREAEVYENVEAENIQIDDDYIKSCDAIFFTCGSSLERTAKALGGKFPHGCRLITIGPKCSAVAEKCNVGGYIQAKEASYRSMADTVKNI